MIIENALVDQARAGGSALDRLITAVWPKAYRIALSIVRDRGLAEDAAQDACAAIAASLPLLQNTAAFPGWSCKIIARHAITALRRRRPAESLDRAAQTRVEFDASESLDLYDAIGQLPAPQRAAVILHYYAGFNSAEIASATGLPGSTVRFHLMLARKTLRAALSDERGLTQCPLT